MNIIHLLDNSGSKLSFSSEPLHIYIIFLKIRNIIRTNSYCVL